VAVPLNGNRVKTGTSSEEIQAYRTELQSIEIELRSAVGDEKTLLSLQSREVYLQRQLINLAGSDMAQVKPPAKGWMIAFGLCLLSGGLGIYSLIGTPELTGDIEVMRPIAEKASLDARADDNMETLVAQLGERLKNGQGDAQGWGLYGRSLMTLRRFDEVFKLRNQWTEMIVKL